jgi:hypothetical protein
MTGVQIPYVVRNLPMIHTFPLLVFFHLDVTIREHVLGKILNVY